MLLLSRKNTNARLMSDIIVVNNLVEVYSDGTKAVDNISFSVKEGEFFGFLGPNGAARAKLVELKEAADKRARNYSGGMKKRLDLASALVHMPKLLFLDEPTTGLDPQSRAAMWTYLEKLNKIRVMMISIGSISKIPTTRANLMVYPRLKDDIRVRI
jgi:ABC-type multidrug transport system ATPase subunit